MYWTEYFALRFLFRPDFFMKKKTEKERLEAVLTLNSNVHHFIVVFFAFVTLLTQCDVSFGYIRMEEQCLRTYKPIYSHVIVFSFAH